MTALPVVAQTAFGPMVIAACEQVGPAEYAERYLVPLGRDLTVSPIERFVYADRQCR